MLALAAEVLGRVAGSYLAKAESELDRARGAIRSGDVRTQVLGTRLADDVHKTLNWAEKAAKAAGGDAGPILARVAFQRAQIHSALASHERQYDKAAKAASHDKDCIRYYQTAVAADPDFGTAWFNLGLFLLDVDKAKAADAFQKAADTGDGELSVKASRELFELHEELERIAEKNRREEARRQAEQEKERERKRKRAEQRKREEEERRRRDEEMARQRAKTERRRKDALQKYREAGQRGPDALKDLVAARKGQKQCVMCAEPWENPSFFKRVFGKPVCMDCKLEV